MWHYKTVTNPGALKQYASLVKCQHFKPFMGQTTKKTNKLQTPQTASTENTLKYNQDFDLYLSTFTLFNCPFYLLEQP